MDKDPLRGFTFIELLVVLLIVSMISVLSVPVLRVSLANREAYHLAYSLKTRIEEALSHCSPHIYEGCLLAFSPSLINKSTLSTISYAASNHSYRYKSGDINFVQFYRTFPYSMDALVQRNRAFHARDDVTNYSSSFNRIHAIGYQDGNYFTRFFVKIYYGHFVNKNQIYVYPDISFGESEFFYAKAYRLSLLGSRVDMCTIYFRDCRSATSFNFSPCAC